MELYCFVRTSRYREIQCYNKDFLLQGNIQCFVRTSRYREKYYVLSGLFGIGKYTMFCQDFSVQGKIQCFVRTSRYRENIQCFVRTSRYRENIQCFVRTSRYREKYYVLSGLLGIGKNTMFCQDFSVQGKILCFVRTSRYREKYNVFQDSKYKEINNALLLLPSLGKYTLFCYPI